MTAFYGRVTSVRGYIKSDGVRVSGHHRSETNVNFEDYSTTFFSHAFISQSSDLFRTNCLDCGEEVWFVRECEYRDSFTADQIEPSFVVHTCWRFHRYNAQKKMEQIVLYLTQEKGRLIRAKNLTEQRAAMKKWMDKETDIKVLIEKIIQLPTLKLPEVLDSNNLGRKTITVSNILSKLITITHKPNLKTYVVWAHTDDSKFLLAISEHLYIPNKLELCKIAEADLNFLERSKGGLLYIYSDNPPIIDTVDMSWTLTTLTPQSQYNMS